MWGPCKGPSCPCPCHPEEGGCAVGGGSGRDWLWEIVILEHQSLQKFPGCQAVTEDSGEWLEGTPCH